MRFIVSVCLKKALFSANVKKEKGSLLFIIYEYKMMGYLLFDIVPE